MGQCETSHFHVKTQDVQIELQDLLYAKKRERRTLKIYSTEN